MNDKDHEKHNESIIFYNKVRQYIELEYSEDIALKMGSLKYVDICWGYIKNCLYLKKSIPETANGVFFLLSKIN